MPNVNFMSTRKRAISRETRSRMTTQSIVRLPIENSLRNVQFVLNQGAENFSHTKQL